jgi:CO/xanthine dehydrogenase FAD-binding subunit
LKPPPFTYHAAKTAQDAIALLAEDKEQARVLAGGQSLVPLMNFRLAQPDHLIDINPSAELDYIRRTDGVLAIGARTRQSELERSVEAGGHAPLLVEAVKLVAHAPIRHRGTVAGSLAHADPAAELPTAALALGGEMLVMSARGQRTVPVADFFKGPFATALAPDELLVEYRAPAWPAGTGHAFLEFSRTHGNFAVVGVAALVRMDGRNVERAAIALCGVAGTPVRAVKAEQELNGRVPSDQLIEAAAEAAVAGLEPASDVHGSKEYRRKVARVFVRRALRLAIARAKGERS